MDVLLCEFAKWRKDRHLLSISNCNLLFVCLLYQQIAKGKVLFCYSEQSEESHKSSSFWTKPILLPIILLTYCYLYGSREDTELVVKSSSKLGISLTYSYLCRRNGSVA